MNTRALIAAPLSLILAAWGCGGAQEPAARPAPTAAPAAASTAASADGEELTDEDRENMALSDCLGICDMIFNCRPEITAVLGAEDAIALMGEDDDMEHCHGICMGYIHDIQTACFDCYDLDLSCERMAACLKGNCPRRQTGL